MNLDLQALSLQALPVVELDTAGAATRALRMLGALLAFVAIPLGFVVALPLVGGLLLAFVLFSPLILVYVLVQAWRQDEEERSQPAA